MQGRLGLDYNVSGVYGVMQSDGNNVNGDVVLDNFDMAYGDEDSILYQKYEKQIFWDCYYQDFKID